MTLELKAAATQDVAIFAPYYREPSKKSTLPYAITLYRSGEVMGERAIEGGTPIPFEAKWRISNLPSDLTLCRVMFDDDEELSYEVMMENSEFVDYLIDLIINMRNNEVVDFPQAFYSKLFRIQLTTPDLV
ncbi:hypothetical protein Pse7367_1490 [Thalassoporum mexicanum PCC 7367]|uniref:type IV pilus biogenesis protein EbsA n=1 Tax=Thalassoporum mexicanum TaxID=3457544 RepID=UPI00029FFCBA|nr:type IV pilus biogenesis protein EbsA [Pseudanabaena sp. PCC 7367]AFY69780.1 hypothetical protein Pse7367_1490 [Pseudanabaena sp. PCC 7367]